MRMPELWQCVASVHTSPEGEWRVCRASMSALEESGLSHSVEARNSAAVSSERGFLARGPLREMTCDIMV